MAIQQNETQQQTTHQSFSLDALYCEEEQQWDEEEEVRGDDCNVERETNNMNNKNHNGSGRNPSLYPMFLMEQDLFWEDEELLSLFSKEQQKKTEISFGNVETESHPSFVLSRRETVEWMLKINAHYGFSTLTATLCINYLDRFLSSLSFQKDKPWMIQLAAVTCVSLAAKVEETQVPLLLDLQVEDAKYVFDEKTIRRMELLVLSTLQWRMNPVTPLSFLDHITRRLGLKINLHWEFLRRSESLLLCVIADSRSVRYLPSVLATAIMLHVIPQVEPCNAFDCQNQLLDVLKISKEEVNDCYQLIVEISNTCFRGQNNPHKRKHQQVPAGSPSCAIGASFNSSASSNDSWAVVGSSVCSSPEPHFKKIRVQEQQMRLTSLNKVFVDVVGSPPLNPIA